MNIFVLDQCPIKSAQMMCDKHVVKMILESAQMLSTCHRVVNGYDNSHKDTPYDVIYKSAHINHHCNKGVRESYKIISGSMITLLH